MKTTALLAALLSLATMATGAAARAQTPSAGAEARTPPQRQMVIDLAYVLGQAHALHRACAGAQDNTWRGRMGRLLQAEAPDPAYRQRLMQSFNAGFVASSAAVHGCTTTTAAAERKVAEHGRDLARRLAAGVSP